MKLEVLRETHVFYDLGLLEWGAINTQVRNLDFTAVGQLETSPYEP
jgi:hypothetical protein